MPINLKKGFDVFSVYDEVTFNRIGKRVMVKGRDGTFQESESVEANLLFEILQQIKKGSKAR